MNFGTYNPENAFVCQIDVHELLPHQEPFVMVSRLTHIDKLRTESELLVDSANILVEEGRLTAAGIMENIAQTCALRIGYINKYILGRDIMNGVIGAIKTFEVYAHPEVGELLTTTIEVETEIMGMLLAKAVVRVGEREIAYAEFKMACGAEE